MMRKKVFAKAQKLDQLNAERQWVELVRILEANYSIKSKYKGEIFLNIPNESEADIEIFLNGLISPNNYSVKLWYIQLSDNQKDLQSAQLDTLQSVVLQIDNLLKALKERKA